MEEPGGSILTTEPKTLKELVELALQLKPGWREAIVELEDFCSEPVRLKNMVAAADQLDDWAKQAQRLLAVHLPVADGGRSLDVWRRLVEDAEAELAQAVERVQKLKAAIQIFRQNAESIELKP